MVEIGNILFNRRKIQHRVEELGEQISDDYDNLDNLVIVIILNGAMFFAVDLMRALTIPTEVTTLSLGSYGDKGSTSGIVRLNNDITIDIEGRNVLLVEDIVDTGKTMRYLQALFQFRNPESIKLCSFLSKPGRRETEVIIDYLGYEIDDHFVIGYGLDYKGRFRELPYIAIANLT